MSDNKPTVPELLRAGAATYEERNKLYGDNYKRTGDVLVVLFPDGLPKMDAAGWNRFISFAMVLIKLTRYAKDLRESGPGHQDSARDMMVYSAILEEFTESASHAIQIK